jgi:hypothetical protein
VALSLAAGPAVPAIACFARLIAFGTGLRIQEPFPFPPVTSVPDDERKYSQPAKNPRKIRQFVQ